MARQIPSYPDPQDPTTPIANAYGATAGIYLDLSTGRGRAVLNVYRSAAAAGAAAAPVGQVQMGFGEVLSPGDPNATPPVPPVAADTLPQFQAEPVDPALKAAFAAQPCVGTAWAMVFGALDLQWAKHPALAGSAEVA